MQSCHCWQLPEHSDPAGDTLVRFARAVRRAQAATVGTHNATLPKELGIFYDWCSLFQKERSTEEDAAFRSALARMQLWYAHMLTTVFLMTEEGIGLSKTLALLRDGHLDTTKPSSMGDGSGNRALTYTQRRFSVSISQK